MHAEIAAVLKQLDGWSPGANAELARELLARAERKLRPPAPSIKELVGAGRGDGPLPSDEDLKRWVDEYRTRKYGR